MSEQEDKRKDVKQEKKQIVLPLSLPGEDWVEYLDSHVSSHGRVISGITGKPMTVYSDGRCSINGQKTYVSTVLAKAFKIENYEKLEGHKSHYVVNVRPGASIPPKLEDVSIRTRADVGHDNGLKSKKSERFTEVINMTIASKINSGVEHKVLNDLNMIAFADGYVYSNLNKRFYAFTITSKPNSKNYYHIILKDGTHLYQHKIICYAFHKLEGKETYQDYANLQANHKDGNTLNNHKDNLEWTTQSENMQHAYDTELNNKVQSVIQYRKNVDGSKGEFVAEFRSIAEASRATKIPEHAIRTACGAEDEYVSKVYTEYYWYHKDPKKALEYSKKFSVHSDAGESSLQSKVKKRAKLG
jgi:hypothetical protein